MASVKWSEDALKDLETIDLVITQRIVSKVTWLEEHFAEIVPEKLHRGLKGLYKLRIGDYRVIYTISRNSIVITAVGHRRDVYK